MTPSVPRPDNRPDDRQDYRELARQHEANRDLPAALDAWQTALAAEPEAPDIARHLADLAFRLQHWDMAEKLLAHLILRGHRDPPTVIAYAATLREQSRYDEAVDLLKTVIGQDPAETGLWESLGSVMVAKGDAATAVIFFDEALRLDPGNLHALFNRGCALYERGDMHAALADIRTCAGAFRDPDNLCSAGMASAFIALSLGDLTNGWTWYRARYRAGTMGEVHHDIALPRLSSDQPLEGARLFLSAEQGLGDEVLFGSLIPDIAAAIGPGGRLGLGVEPRLVPLFARSFPQAIVIPHRTQTIDGRIRRGFPGLDAQTFDGWALFGDFLPVLRGTIGAFAGKPAFLKPCPRRQAHWRDWLASLGAGTRAGILWKSLKGGANRDRYFADFDQWLEVMKTPGTTFIDLQYGDSSAETAVAAAAGVTLHRPPGIDLKDDLDDLAALCTVLDVVIGPSNATTNIAAACGAETWLLGVRNAWLLLGETHYPWYSCVRYFAAPRPGDWDGTLASIATELMNR